MKDKQYYLDSIKKQIKECIDENEFLFIATKMLKYDKNLAIDMLEDFHENAIGKLKAQAAFILLKESESKGNKNNNTIKDGFIV